jgi:hypothetical protein
VRHITRGHLAAAIALTLIAVAGTPAGPYRPALRRHPKVAAAAPNRQPLPAPAGGTPLLTARHVNADRQVTGWALSTITGEPLAGDRTGYANHAASTIKIWLAGDALRRAGQQPTWSLLDDARAAIVDSDNNAANRLYRAGGGHAGLLRMIDTCRLVATLPDPTGWGKTRITAGDLAALGACAASGQIAGPTWTPWLLQRMREVHPPGRFGPVDALPGADVALKNGWTTTEGQWHVNCLAIINQTWVLAVTTRYPASLDLAHGAQMCTGLTRQLAAPAPAGARPAL